MQQLYICHHILCLLHRRMRSLLLCSSSIYVGHTQVESIGSDVKPIQSVLTKPIRAKLQSELTKPVRVERVGSGAHLTI
jgi:hypothetical protein